MRRLRIWATVLTLGVVLLLSLANVVAAADSTLVVALSYAPKFLNINYDFDGANYFIVDNIFDRLITYDVNYNFIGELAESWTVSDDGLTYTFHLRPGVKWHDGEPFTSSDVVWTIESLFEEEGYGAAAVPGVVKVEAIDDLTVALELERPDSTFLHSLARRYGFTILPKHLYEGTDPRENPQNWEPIGTGPFRFVEMVAGSHVTLEANEDYFLGAPRIKNLVFRTFMDMSAAVAALEAGEVQFLSSAPPFPETIRLMSTPGIATGAVQSEILVWLGFNLTREPLNDIRVRMAIAHAIDRDQIAELVYRDLLPASQTVYLSILTDYLDKTAKLPEYNPELAREILEEAGYTADSRGVRLHLTYTGFRASVWGAQEIGDVMRQQLAEVGIDLTVEFYDFAVFAEKIQKNHDFDITWSGGPAGPHFSEFRNFVGSSGARNVMGYDNPEVDDLFAIGAGTTDDTLRRIAYQRIQRLIAADVPRLSLVEWKYIYPYEATYHGFWWQEEALGQVPRDCYRLVWKEG